MMAHSNLGACDTRYLKTDTLKISEAPP